MNIVCSNQIFFQNKNLCPNSGNLKPDSSFLCPKNKEINFAASYPCSNNFKTYYNLQFKKQNASTQTPKMPKTRSQNFTGNEIVPLSDEQSLKNRLKVMKHFDLTGSFFESCPHLLYRTICDGFYSEIRTLPKDKSYPRHDDELLETVKFARSHSRHVQSFTQKGWIFREPAITEHDYWQRPTVERISLNVNPDVRLLLQLDDFIANFEGGAHYKIENSDFWYARFDPITIYFPKKISDETADEIAKIAKPYVRTEFGDVLPGRKIADGVALVSEPNEDDIEKIFSRAKKMNLDNSLISYLGSTNKITGADLFEKCENGECYINSSPGVVASINKMLDELEKIDLA